MTLIPESERNTASLINQWHEDNQERPRGHMGCSRLGHHCDRFLWLEFRWAVQEKFPGRILRLFRRGHNEENWFVEDLKAIGVSIRDYGETQSRVDFGCHISGSIDGVIDSGVPEAPKTPHIAEFKTHGEKSFKKLVKEGVKESKPEHWVQMQLYMHGKNLTRALYGAVNKNDDDLYFERVNYERAAAEKYLERGRRIVTADRIPDPCSTDPSWWKCKFCSAYSFCHEEMLTKHVNCRTCAHSTAMPNSAWRCERHNADGIPEDYQHGGCDDHVLHPDMVPWKLKAGNQLEALYEIDGVDIRNGHPDCNVYSSHEILAMNRGEPVRVLEHEVPY